MAAPFTFKYVVGVTIDRQIRCIESSLEKTLVRSREPNLPLETNLAIVRTIQYLIQSRQQLLAQKANIG